jgi:hypothetical protein
VEVAAGAFHTLARLDDGTVIGWGLDGSGQATSPPPPPGTTFVRIAAGWVHSLALCSDGNVVAWGDNQSGQCNVPALPAGLVYLEVAGGLWNSAALRSDGAIVVWGGSAAAPPPPPGLTYAGVAAGGSHLIGRLSDGSVVHWGSPYAYRSFMPDLPAGTTCTSASAGSRFSALILRSAYTSFCSGGPGAACPCANNGGSGRGCANSARAEGAQLQAEGAAHLGADTLQLLVAGEPSSALSIVLQGNLEVTAQSFGDGLRCAGGVLKRLYSHQANGGALVVPSAGDPPVSTRSAGLADPIAPGSTRFYQVYYRDPDPAFCTAPQGSTFNVSNGLAVLWMN